MFCWPTYSGTHLPIEEILFKPSHSFIDQSLNAWLVVNPTNGDGFGIGWDYRLSQRHARWRLLKS